MFGTTRTRTASFFLVFFFKSAFHLRIFLFLLFATCFPFSVLACCAFSELDQNEVEGFVCAIFDGNGRNVCERVVRPVLPEQSIEINVIYHRRLFQAAELLDCDH